MNTLFGFEDKVKAFKELTAGHRLGHAYLFFGEAGVGKGTFARALAHFLEGGDFTPAEATLIDVFWCAPTEGVIGIDAVRALRMFLSQTPLRSPYRLAVVDDAHLLTAEAQGALLKIVEEPPPHGLLVLIAHDAQALLPPLLSRLERIYFPRLAEAELREVLVREFKVPVARAREVAHRSFGRLGRALSLIEGEGEEETGTLAGDLEARILGLWERGAETHAPALAYLLDRESVSKRYNVNENLQRKAVRSHLASTSARSHTRPAKRP